MKTAQAAKHFRETSQFAQNTYKGRYPKHNQFLKVNRDKIRVFVDVGCSIKNGAPTTIEAREALGKKARCFATDIFDDPPKEARREFRKRNICYANHDISKIPFLVDGKEHSVDCMRVANVSFYLSQSQRRRALINILRSIKPGGFLIISHSTDVGEFGYLFKVGKDGRSLIEIPYPGHRLYSSMFGTSET